MPRLFAAGQRSLAGVMLFGDTVGWRFAAGSTLIIGSTIAIQLERTKPKGHRSPKMKLEGSP
jgi:drug/metabolite transporter (DMT)-like permease